MIDILNAQETILVNILNSTGDLDDVLSGMPDPIDSTYNIARSFVQKTNPDINIQYNAETNHATIDLVVPFEFEIVAIPSMIGYSQDDALKKLLKKSIEDHLKSITEDLIAKTQEDYRAEPFNWAIYIRQFFKDIPSFEEADWSESIYPNAEVTIDYRLQRLEFGKSLYDTNMKEMSD